MKPFFIPTDFLLTTTWVGSSFLTGQMQKTIRYVSNGFSVHP